MAPQQKRGALDTTGGHQGMRLSVGLAVLLLSAHMAWAQDSTLALKPAPAPPREDTLRVNFNGTTCTPEQRAAGDAHDMTGQDTVPGAVAPQLTSLPQYHFQPAPTDRPPIRVHLTYVINAKGKVDLCTVRVIGAHTPDWTQTVLQFLPDVRYRPGTLDGKPVRVWVHQPFSFVPR
jgi:hypothetical protein